MQSHKGWDTWNKLNKKQSASKFDQINKELTLTKKRPRIIQLEEVGVP